MELKPCPFCGAVMTLTPNGDLWGWHSVDCFFQMLEVGEEGFMVNKKGEGDMTEEEIKTAFVEAWNRRANDV